MIKSVVLRFKDGEEPTIQRHSELLAGFDRTAAAVDGVWWGWWKKTDHQEPFPENELAMASATASSTGLMLGIVDRDQGQYCMARCTKVRQAGGVLLGSPDPDRTPLYYRDSGFPAWFFLTELIQITKGKWVNLFGPIPAGVPTIYFENASRERRVANIVDTCGPHGTGLVHLSDIHLGSGHRFSDPLSIARDARPHLLERLAEVPLSPAGVVISGDLLTRGAKESYPNALKFLNDLADCYQVPKERIVVVPGNHDIPASDSDPELGYPATGEFIGFLREFYQDEVPIERVHEFSGSDGIQYVLGTVNSSQYRSQETMDFGYVQESAAEAVVREIARRGGAHESWRFLVMHHHVMTASADEQVQRHGEKVRPVSVTMNGGHIVDLCGRFGVDAILRGHQHLPFIGSQSRTAHVYADRGRAPEFEDRPVLELAAGAAGAESGMMDSLMNENSFNYYAFSGSDVRVSVFAYNDRVKAYSLPGWQFSTSRRVGPSPATTNCRCPVCERYT